MPRQFALVIGINHYRYYPQHPLQFAENDAVAMEAYLGEVKFTEVWRYSDQSPRMGQHSTQPERTNLLRAINRLSNQLRLQPDDSFWFFFSGHGARQAGQDYLLPSDGDPENLTDTAIPIYRVLRALSDCRAGNLILILDACRNHVPDQSKDIGNQTADLAKQTGIITLFSCSPGERSYELPDRKQGAFTYALLDALRGNCPPSRTNAQDLSNYLRQQVPRLASRKGSQTPYVVAEPVEKAVQPLLPVRPSAPPTPAPNIDKLIRQANRHYHNRDFGAARQRLREVLREATKREDREEALELLERIESEMQPPPQTPPRAEPSPVRESVPTYRPPNAPAARDQRAKPSSPPASAPSSQPKTAAAVASSSSAPVSQPGTNWTRQKFLRVAIPAGIGVFVVSVIGELSRQEDTPQNSQMTSGTVDYSTLESLMQAGDWRGADEETFQIMLQVANREEEGWLDTESLENFPCEVLQRLDDLWVQYSDGKFGFSVQTRIWQEVGSPTSYNEQWEAFGDRVGWRKEGSWLSYSDLQFNPDLSPAGELPGVVVVGGLFVGDMLGR